MKIFKMKTVFFMQPSPTLFDELAHTQMLSLNDAFEKFLMEINSNLYRFRSSVCAIAIAHHQIPRSTLFFSFGTVRR